MLTEGATPEEAEIIEEHFAYLGRLTMEPVALLLGRTLTTDQDSMGIIIFKARSHDRLSAGKPCLLGNKRTVSRCISYKESVKQLKG